MIDLGRLRPAAARGPRLPEPTTRLRLAWGDYQGRMVVGVGFLIGGAALVVQTTAYTVGLGLLGSGLHLAGWALQPARGRTRALVAVPSMLACWATMSGPKTMWLLAFCLAAWLAVRERPPRTYLTLVLPLGVGSVLAAAYSHAADKQPAFLLLLGALLAGAWLARWIALRPKPVLTQRIGTGETECGDTP
jgi:hypothetical protein